MSESLSIMAIGGGAPHLSSADLVKRAVELTGVEQPNALLIPTAKVTQDAYGKSVASAENIFSQQLGIPFSVLHDFDQMPPATEIEEKLKAADLVYIAGGDTARMMEIWKTHGIDAILKTRALGGLVLSGISAGAIAPFTWGHSDSMSYRVPEGEAWDYWPVPGLELVPGAITPHYNTTRQDIPRSVQFHDMFRLQQAIAPVKYGFGIDDQAAIEIFEGKLSLKQARPDAYVTVVQSDGDSITEHRLTAQDSIELSEITVELI